MQHRDLHDVTGCALNRHVDRFAFGCSPNVCVAIVDPSQRANAPIKGTNITVLARLHWNLVHVTAHTFVGCVIIVDDFARFLPADTDALRQTPGFDRVSNRKVYNLGKASRFL